MKRVYVADSGIAGKGVFAGEDINEGDIVVQIEGQIMNRKLKSEKDSQRFANWIGMGEDVWLNPNKTKFRYLNHSCEPSTAIIDGHKMVALRDLKKGDEITFDYSLTDIDPNWRMDCFCGTKSCRKVILPLYNVPPEVFKKHYPNVPQYFQREFIRHYISQQA